MKILKSWLKDYIDLDLDNDKLAEILSLSGTAVDSYEQTLDQKIIVSEIREVSKHPNADRLRVAKVWTGAEELQIVCGAPNIAVGQKVPLAQIGTVLGEDFVIKQAVIRGVESFGMLCAQDEIGLGTDHSGIMILPDDYEVGKPLSDYIASDAVFEIEVTPNRGDTLSHLGVARELSAILQKPLKNNPTDTLEINEKNSDLDIEISSPDLCKQYFGLKINGIKVQESPDWLKDRLIKCGQRPINNIVDITNYIMLDTGQPMHAFDADKIEKGIVVRKALFGEGLVTLDGNIRNLDEGMLVIADHKKPIALAGIMGGANSEVDDQTQNIILEAAEFDRTNIRKTAKELNLSTDASYRFERGVDSANTEAAIKKAANLIVELAGGKVASNITAAGEKPLQDNISVQYDKINALLGLKLKEEEIDRILTGLGFVVSENKALVPSWRHDISIWQDLAEEVARIYGYNQIPPSEVPKTVAPSKSSYYYKEYVKDILVKNGFSEIYSYSFLSEADLRALDISSNDLLEVINPISPENRFLRKSIIPSLLKAVAKNPTFDHVFLFEIGHAFTKERETVYLSLATSGKNAKNTIEKAIEKIANLSGTSAKDFNIRELTRDDLVRFKIKKPVTFVAEIEIEKIVEGLKKRGLEADFEIDEKKIHYREISKFPSLTRDLAFIVDSDQSTDKLTDTMYNISDLICRIELFDEFASDKFGKNKKNVAFHLYLQHMERTLTDPEANVVIEDIIQTLDKKFNAKLRNQ